MTRISFTADEAGLLVMATDLLVVYYEDLADADPDQGVWLDAARALDAKVRRTVG